MGNVNPLYPYFSGMLIGGSLGMSNMGGIYDLPTTLLPLALVMLLLGLVVTVVGIIRS
ncbi:Uncharacterised protein [Mycobacteroides abscessus subsp. abscessus]|uniref:Uncharacterized protein n=1 Tax=Mycobacteroides abscessus subsp. abscessus TaxID=1185650 RepID=A0AB38D0W4_9MYCO|nr:Uncharacterised protein [Mycobacteroides abscessus subsp. abscessus]SKU87202.1 Uncharacterised protein [Mycobacteroides abscessus subsp. bolletii]SIA13395.1 Uncharacterised protein [Mycobacteroides abscessus subsp. abscessus]SIB13345.1 Uncharacterised protein [Mycobacteroides abscessus subsp. abscessus]SIB15551.1 Uncharacterised protein [Mycobacteroides abscessus subsp. abscessus]